MAITRKGSKIKIAQDIKLKYLQGACLRIRQRGVRKGSEKRTKRSSSRIVSPPLGGWLGGDPLKNGFK